MTPRPESPGDEKLLADVERYGWHYMYVAPRVGDPEPHLFWGYTIGLNTSLGHPDILLFDPRQEESHAIVGSAISLVREGQRLESGRDYDNVLENYPVRFLDIDPKWYGPFVGFAQWYYESPSEFAFVQLVTPDRDGLYPWDPGSRFAGEIPLLVSDDDARALGLDS